MGILRALRQERGALSMEYVRALDDEAVKKELCRFKGVGPKTAACVLLFCLRRADFPVDTHVWRISKKLGWVPESASRTQAYEHLNRRIPDDVKLSLHVLLVEHGKCCQKCAKNGKPRRSVVGPCPLTFSRISLEKELALAAGSVKVKAEPAAAAGRIQVKAEPAAAAGRVQVKVEPAAAAGRVQVKAEPVAAVGSVQVKVEPAAAAGSVQVKAEPRVASTAPKKKKQRRKR
jgi:hypothetical protein